MNEDYQIFEIETEDDMFEIELTLKFTHEDAGIGAYECHGVRGFQSIEYKEIHDVLWDKTPFSDEMNAEIERQIDDRFEEISEKFNT